MLMHALASSFLNYPLIHVSLIIFKLRKNKNFQFFQFVAVIGTAFALNILFHIPIWTGVLITGLSTLLLLGLQRYGVIYFITYLKFSAPLFIKKFNWVFNFYAQLYIHVLCVIFLCQLSIIYVRFWLAVNYYFIFN